VDDSRDMRTIVWDLDDVLNHFTESWLKLAWQVEHPECRATCAELRSNPPLRELKASESEYFDSLDRFRISPAAQNLEPQPQVLAWFRQSGHHFRHHVLTARPVKSAGPAAAWVFTHFGRWIRHFHFVPSPRPGESLPAYEATKGEVLARIGPVDFFVDDSPQNVAAAAACGARAFVFPQPWNRAELTVTQILAALSRNPSP
jgi:phosphoglycolate phosphatase-like HAD superfamily hydrolase